MRNHMSKAQRTRYAEDQAKRERYHIGFHNFPFSRHFSNACELAGDFYIDDYVKQLESQGQTLPETIGFVKYLFEDSHSSAANHVAHNGGKHAFLFLPPELRNKIYKYAFKNGNAIDDSTQSVLTRTNRTIRNESLGLFYAHTTVALRFEFPPFRMGRDGLTMDSLNRMGLSRDLEQSDNLMRRTDAPFRHPFIKDWPFIDTLSDELNLIDAEEWFAEALDQDRPLPARIQFPVMYTMNNTGLSGWDPADAKAKSLMLTVFVDRKSGDLILERIESHEHGTGGRLLYAANNLPDENAPFFESSRDSKHNPKHFYAQSAIAWFRQAIEGVNKGTPLTRWADANITGYELLRLRFMIQMIGALQQSVYIERFSVQLSNDIGSPGDAIEYPFRVYESSV